MPDPSAASPKSKNKKQKADHGPCPLDMGELSDVCRKDKAVEASTPTTGACPTQHGAWSTLRFTESCKILVVQIRFCTRGRARWTRTVLRPMLINAINEGREKGWPRGRVH
ncbi:hypothetical protein HanXRQr2_Chr17g0807281 [Helianthus annuus]|uniref:Uncharacterized protein n=1 Tax=Helianthus annuus TaxID=4232 RepID=A0A9K3DKW8_HELAN|nr:hypothetical protein HanXRQr2_Chr17g0807281 [Helianthus annuus]